MENEQDTPQGEYGDITERLRSYGSAPLAGDVEAGAFARVRGRQVRASTGRAKWVVAATVAGFVAGSVGLAAADVLPAPVQDVAAHALDAVGVHVPPGHQRFNDPAVCPGGPYANHGAYVRAHHEDPNAGASPCGKPLHSVNAGNGAGDDSGEPAGAHGKGKGKQSKEGRTATGGDENHGHAKDNGNGKGQGNESGNGAGDENGGGLKHQAKPDDNSDTSPDQPTVHATTPSSVPAPTTASAPTTTASTSTTTMPAASNP